ncbi:MULTISPECIES: DUF2127 domain-containing protein [Shewanella]|jgi:uncharacterized membrane protein (DUF2068 family)|uniref:DUF2127 domain-containing protein n=1 Tax=Shewanella TaxID=22 RepID=UPI0019BC22BD|nr:DUF2127 domain-containing protein [Shewanella fodinae]MCL2907121.1 DUF2127 domain-containing protein [Shewanella fodinae]GGZ06372.1 membrane protein [Shewanella fodinae]
MFSDFVFGDFVSGVMMVKADKGLRVVALLEASKGVLSLIVGLGIHALAGKDLKQSCELLLTHLHLNPASHLPGIFLHAAESLGNINLTLIAIGALVYSCIRFVEAYGLWHSMVWTEWFALVSGGIYLPFEAYEVVVHHNLLSIATLAVNLLIVGYMAWLLRRKPAIEH